MLRGGGEMTVAEVLAPVALEAPAEARRSPRAPDEILLVPFPDGGGLLSYRKPDGRCVHTLNDAAGWARKLADLGLSEGA